MQLNDVLNFQKYLIPISFQVLYCSSIESGGPLWAFWCSKAIYVKIK